MSEFDDINAKLENAKRRLEEQNNHLRDIERCGSLAKTISDATNSVRLMFESQKLDIEEICRTLHFVGQEIEKARREIDWYDFRLVELTLQFDYISQRIESMIGMDAYWWECRRRSGPFHFGEDTEK